MKTAELWNIARTGLGVVAALTLVATGYAFLPASVAAEESKAPQVGFMAQDFTLTDTEGNSHNLSSYLKDGKTVVMEWFSPGCPYVRKYHEGADANLSMREAYRFAAEHDVVWLAINSNAPGTEGSGLELNRQKRSEFGIEYPVLLDEDGTVGRAFGASSTPHMFIISPEGQVLYNGGADDTKLNSDTPGINYIVNALTQYMAGEEIDPAATPHPGCSVKYAK